MMRFVIRSLSLSVVAAALALFSPAQSDIGHSAGKGQMFVGETLKFDAKLDKILRGISVGEMTFVVSRTPESSELVIRSEAVSKGTLLKLFRFSFLQQYDSIVDLASFRILRTKKHDVQKSRVRDSEAVFDYRNRTVTFVETDPKTPMRPPRRIASEIGDQMYDMISAIYAVRMLPLEVGRRYEFPVSDSGLVYRVPFVVAARETQSTIFGKIACLRIEPEIFGMGRLIEQKGSMTIWMTDDDRHVPVRAQVKSELGKINIKLKAYTKSTPQTAART